MAEAEKKKGWGIKWLVLLTVIVGTFLGRLDQTIVNLALPKIIDNFGITVSTAGWIATAYILANAVFVPIWGKLGDTMGRKKVYIWGFSVFIIGSLLAAFSWNLSSMIVFRVIQAIAAIKYAEKHNKHLYFHINSERIEQGNSILQNIIITSLTFDRISTVKSEGVKIKMILKDTKSKIEKLESFYDTVTLRGSIKN